MIRSIEQTLFRLDNLNAEQERISYQMSTGKKLQYGSDDSTLYAREIYVDDKIRVYEGVKKQIERTNTQNNVSDATLSEVKELVAYVKSEAIKALNATSTDESRFNIAVNLEGVKKNFLSLGNEASGGEYLFSGTNPSVKPFVQDDITGKVTYQGDSQLRKVAVEDGYYRERGVTGLEAFFYSSNTAYKGDSLEFTADARIFDQDGNEWRLNGTTIEQLDVDGNPISPAVIKSPVSNNGATPPTYSVPVGTDDGTKFEAKINIFDTLDNIISALREEDNLGNTISSEEAKESLQNGIDEIALAYDGTNGAHGKLGARNKIFELSLERVNTKLAQFNILSLEIGAADLSKVAVESKALELTYTALYSTINKVNELSLVNFIR